MTPTAAAAALLLCSLLQEKGCRRLEATGFALQEQDTGWYMPLQENAEVCGADGGASPGAFFRCEALNGCLFTVV